MSVCIFVGPTLSRAEVVSALDAQCLPPAAQGDVYRAARARPRAIGIIDGYFSGAPSVWHKEILWALSQGIAVYGSSSMGALRAAELHSFGMRGVGRIFEAFRDGVLEDDDEVAVVHGPAELGFAGASEPMVNIRATLSLAESTGALGASSRRGLEDYAKSLFYPRRSWPTVLAGEHGVPAGDVAALEAWLPSGRVDQKRADAVAMLRAMRSELDRADRAPANFRFEWTQFWDELVVRLAGEPAPQDDGTLPAERVLDELRLAGDGAYERVQGRALTRLLGALEAARRGIDASPEAMRATLGRLRTRLGLYSRAALDDWLARNDLDAAAAERLIGEETRLDAVAAQLTPAFAAAMLDELKLGGAYERLAARAAAKRAALASQGLDDAHGAGERDGARATALRLWFFEQRLGRQLPDDLAAAARDFGFASLPDFDSALRREQLYFLQQPAKNRDA
jgi:hypothetical protein